MHAHVQLISMPRMPRRLAVMTILLLLLAVLHGCSSNSPSEQQYSELLQEAYSSEGVAFVQEHTRQLHKIPELGFTEVKTSAYLRQVLDDLSIPYRHSIAETGIIANIGTGRAPIVALRADMDALPITEPDDLNAGQGGWASTHTGNMHACGHDTHMAMLLGAARILKARESSLQGTVRLLFQPAEEGAGGAPGMIEAGALQDVKAISGIHVFPALPCGTIGTKAGVIMAASDRFAITVQGRGGHGAMPHLAADPVVASAAIIMALQSLVSRETSPTYGTVVTVGQVSTGAGGAFNIIPHAVELKGTIRALSTEQFARLQLRVRQVAEGTAAVYGCNVSSFSWSPVPYQPTINDAGMAQMALKVAHHLEAAAAEHGGQCKGPYCHLHPEGAAQSSIPHVSAQQLQEPSMAAEDFSFYGKKVPAVFSFLGIADHSKGTDASLHNPHFQMNEDVLPLGVALHAAMAFEMLAKHASSSSTHRTDEL